MVLHVEKGRLVGRLLLPKLHRICVKTNMVKYKLKLVDLVQDFDTPVPTPKYRTSSLVMK